jgi:hypothetical protein
VAGLDHCTIQELSETAAGRTSKRAHEIIQFLKRERFFQNRRSSDKKQTVGWDSSDAGQQ